MKISSAHMHAPKFEAVSRLTTLNSSSCRVCPPPRLFFVLSMMGDADAPLMQDVVGFSVRDVNTPPHKEAANNRREVRN